jgi:hypothetical protein
MIRTLATITGSTLVVVERNDMGLTTKIHLEVARPANLAAADIELAAAGLARTSAWDLDEMAHVSAPVGPMDNEFNGVRAAKLWDKVGVTHDEFELALASTVENGDLVTDSEFCVPYLVAGSSTECGSTKLHMVGEGQTWADRHTGEFRGLVQVARKR